MASTSVDIHHNEKSQRFFTPLPGHKEALLEYRLTDAEGETPTTINFTRTYVPPDFRDRGIAEALVRHGIRWAKEKDYRMTASCWYAAKFVGKDMGVMSS